MIFISPTSTGRLKLSVYVVTAPVVRKGKPIDELEQHAIVFDEWQEIDGLTVPQSAQYYSWKNDTIKGDALGRMSFSNVRFSPQPLDDSKFAQPKDAVIAPLL